MVQYLERLKPLMDDAKLDTTGLAKKLKITFQAVKKVENGGSFGSVNNLHAAELFGVNPKWLANEEGPKYLIVGDPGAASATGTTAKIVQTVLPPLIVNENTFFTPTVTLRSALDTLANAITDSPNRGSDSLVGTFASFAKNPENPVHRQVLEVLLQKEVASESSKAA